MYHRDRDVIVCELLILILVQVVKRVLKNDGIMVNSFVSNYVLGVVFFLISTSVRKGSK